MIIIDLYKVINHLTTFIFWDLSSDNLGMSMMNRFQSRSEG